MQNRKNVSKGALLAGLLLLLAAALLTLFFSARDRAAPTLVKKGSFFSDFAVEEDRVYFLCRLTIHNPQDEPVYAQVTGDFSADRKGGLVLSRESAAFRLEEETAAAFFSLNPEEKEAALSFEARLFPLQPGDNSFWVVFWDLHGENDQKQDRLLPPLTFTPLQDVTPDAVSKVMDCRIVMNAENCETFLVDGPEIRALGVGPGGYGFTSAVPWDYDDNGTPDLLFTYSWGSGIHRAHVALFNMTTHEESDPLFTAYHDDFGCSDLLVRREQDEIQVLAVDVKTENDSFADLRFIERAIVGTIDSENGEPNFRYRATTFSPGEQIEGNEVYGIFVREGLYTVRLYNSAGDTVWSFGPYAREPHVVQEEDDLWSVSVQAGTGIGTRWTVYYDAAADLLSDSRYAVFDRQNRLIVCAALDALIIMDIFDGRILCRLEDFAEPLAPTIDPFLSAAFTEDGKAVSVTYLAGEDYHEVTETVPLPEEFCP